MTSTSRIAVAGLFVLALVISPARAGITHNRRSPSQTYSPFLPLTFGFGMQFETSNDQNRYDFPILIEYNFSQTIKLSLEPSLVYIDSKVDDPDVTTASGFGDTELTFAYEFLRERRYRPALTIEGITKFPTASIAELGDPGQDYGIALIASKGFGRFDADLSARYSWTGDPDALDSLELALGVSVPINRRFELLAELVQTFEFGNNGQSATEGTVGASWRVNRYLRFEQGVTFKDDGTWQTTSSFEWSLAGEN